MRGRTARLFFFAGLFVVTLAAYRPAWHGGRLWDDDAHLTGERMQTARGLGRIWTSPGATQQYYPLAHSAFWVMHRAFGDDTLGYHLVNIALHALSACLIALLLRRAARVLPLRGHSPTVRSARCALLTSRGRQ